MIVCFLINAEHTSAFKPKVPAHSLFSLLICEGIFKNLGLKAKVFDWSLFFSCLVATFSVPQIRGTSDFLLFRTWRARSTSLSCLQRKAGASESLFHSSIPSCTACVWVWSWVSITFLVVSFGCFCFLILLIFLNTFNITYLYILWLS